MKKRKTQTNVGVSLVWKTFFLYLKISSQFQQYTMDIAFHRDCCMGGSLPSSLRCIDLEAADPTPDEFCLGLSFKVTLQGSTADNNWKAFYADAFIGVRNSTSGQIRWCVYSMEILTHLQSLVDFKSAEICFSFHVCSSRGDTGRKKSCQTSS